MIETNIFTGARDNNNNTWQDSDEVKLSTDLLLNYHSQKSTWAKDFKSSDDFRHGIQWTSEQKAELENRNQSPIVINVIHSAVEQAVALLTSNKPRFHASAREESDLRTASIFSDLMAYIWEHSDGNVELKKIVDDYYVGGMGIMQVYYDSYKDMGKGDICVKSLDPMDVYIDPNSKDIYCRDAAHILVARQYSKEQILHAYPMMVEKILEAKKSSLYLDVLSGRVTDGINTNKIRDNQSSIYDVIERFTKLRIQKFRINNRGEESLMNEEEYKAFYMKPSFKMVSSDGSVTWATKEEEINYYADLFQKGDGFYHLELNPESQSPEIVPGRLDEGGIPQSEVQMDLLTISHAISEGVIQVAITLEPRVKRVLTIGDVLLYTEVIESEDYPIIPFMNHHHRNPYPMGDIHYVRNDQEFINKVRSLIIAHASNSTNAKWWVPRGSANISALQEGFQKAGAFIGEYDAELGVPQQANPTPLPNGLYNLEQSVRNDIQERLGIYPFMQGDSTGAPQTYKGTLALDEFGQRRIRSKREDIESALNHVARVVIQYIQIYYREERVFRLLMPNNTTKDVAINATPHNEAMSNIIGKINDVTKGKYDIILVSGSTMPSNRWARFEYYMELYKNGIIDQEEVLKQTDVVDMEGVLARRNQMMQMQQTIEQQQSEIKRLNGDLQTAQRESVQDRKRVEVEKYKAKLNNSNNRAELATELYNSRLNDKLKEANPTSPYDLPSVEMIGEEESQLVENEELY